MNNNGNSRFLDGFMLGIIVGALGVFLFGTKSGKNLMKIISEENSIQILHTEFYPKVLIQKKNFL